LRPESLAKGARLGTAIGGPLGNAVFLALAAAAIYLAWIGRLGARFLPVGVLLVFSACAYIVLPNDWMPEYRFATPFFVFFYLAAGVVTERLVWSLAGTRWLRLGTVAVLAMWFAWSLYVFVPRTERFARSPCVPFDRVARDVVQKFDAHAARLGIRNASLLVPDVGATLYYSRMKVYDLGGLCDREIARTLQKDPTAFYHYVFDRIKPTFIHTHGLWAWRANFDRDARFRRDYVAIQEAEDKWMRTRRGVKVMSGDYVRRDALSPHPSPPHRASRR